MGSLSDIRPAADTVTPDGDQVAEAWRVGQVLPMLHQNLLECAVLL
jgi:hypothetical protein